MLDDEFEWSQANTVNEEDEEDEEDEEEEQEQEEEEEEEEEGGVENEYEKVDRERKRECGGKGIPATEEGRESRWTNYI